MAVIKGFRGIRYNKEKISDFSKVVAPPYDVISPDEQNDFYDKDPFNVIRLILAKGDGDDRYKNASKTYKEWLDSSVLIQDEELSIYPYYQEFEFEGKQYNRKGFIAAVKVEDFETNTVLPHERTFKKHKEDRLKLTTACNSNLSQVFSIYSDEKGLIERIIDENLSDLIADISTEEGVRNIFWKISDLEVISKISELLADKKLLIADGHHRYETSINFRNLQRERYGVNSSEKPYDYVMMYLSRGEGDGLIINPTHRVLKKIATFEIDQFIEKLEQFFFLENISLQDVNDLSQNQMVLITKDPSKTFKLSPKKQFDKGYMNLGVMLLHNIVFKEIVNEEDSEILYTKFKSELVDLINSRDYEAGFLLPKLKAGDIFDVVLDGVKMPHKTTYFYPKVLSGLVFNPLW